MVNSSKNSLWERTECKPYFNYKLVTARERLQVFSCDSIAIITMINTNKRIRVKLITVINSSLQKGTFAGFLLLRITLIQRFSFWLLRNVYSCGKTPLCQGKTTNGFACLSVCKQSKMWNRGLFLDSREEIWVPEEFILFCFLILRLPNSPTLSLFFSSFLAVKGREQQFHLSACARWVNQYIGFALPKYIFY